MTLTDDQLTAARRMIMTERRRIKRVADKIRLADQERDEVAAELTRIFKRKTATSIRIRFNAPEWAVLQNRIEVTKKHPARLFREWLQTGKVEAAADVQIIQGQGGAEDPALKAIGRALHSVALSLNQIALKTNVHSKHHRLDRATADKYATIAETAADNLTAIRADLEKLVAAAAKEKESKS